MFPDLKLVETEASRSRKSYAAADGGEIVNEGEKTIEFMTNEGSCKKVKVQVAAVTKLLLSAVKIVKAGYKVELDDEKPMIKNMKTGETIKIRKKNGIYVMDLWIDTETMGRVFSRPGR